MGKHMHAHTRTLFNISTRKGNRLVCRSVKIMEDELYKDLRFEKVDNKQVTKAERFANSYQETYNLTLSSQKPSQGTEGILWTWIFTGGLFALGNYPLRAVSLRSCKTYTYSSGQCGCWLRVVIPCTDFQSEQCPGC